MLLVPTTLTLLAAASVAAALNDSPARAAAQLERRLTNKQKAAASKSASISKAAASKSQAAASKSSSLSKASASKSKSKAAASKSKSSSLSKAAASKSKSSSLSKASASKAASLSKSASKAGVTLTSAGSTKSSATSAPPKATATGTSGSTFTLPTDDKSYNLGCYASTRADGSYFGGPSFLTTDASACANLCENYAAYQSLPAYTVMSLVSNAAYAPKALCTCQTDVPDLASLVAAPAASCDQTYGAASGFISAFQLTQGTADQAKHAALVALSASGGLKETPPALDADYASVCMSGVRAAGSSGSGRAHSVYSAFADLCPAYSSTTQVVALQAFAPGSVNGMQDGVTYASARCLSAKTLAAVNGTVVDKSLCDSPLYGSADGATYWSVFQLPKNTTVIV